MTVVRDRHVRRSGKDYLNAFLALLPTGQAWPRWEPLDTKDRGHTLWQVCRGLCQYWGFVDARAADLLEQETDPRYSVEMFTDWERNWGLPDPCFFFDGGDIAGRRKTLMRKYTMLGGQSRQFFKDVMIELGYTPDIHENSPFMVGISRVGLTYDEFGGTEQRWRIGPPENRFYWTILPGDFSISWFRAGQSQAAIDPHLRLGYPEDAVCLVEKWKPAHTEIVPDYTGSDTVNNPMAGTP